MKPSGSKAKDYLVLLQAVKELASVDRCRISVAVECCVVKRERQVERRKRSSTQTGDPSGKASHVVVEEVAVAR
jgi:hypothetical protein